MRSRTRSPALFGIAVLLLSLPIASAEEETELETPSPPVVAVLKAHAAGERETLRKIVEDPDIDAWVVAHELCVGGHAAAARAFARSTKLPRLGPLAEHVATLARRPPSNGLWLRRQWLFRIAAEKRWHDYVEDLQKDPVDLTERSVAAADIQYGHGVALVQLERSAEGMEQFLAAGEKARELGWWAGAEKILTAGFEAAMANNEPPRMLVFQRKLFAVHGHSGNRPEAARTLANMGCVLGNVSEFGNAVQQFKRVLAEYSDVLPRDTQLHVFVHLGMAYGRLGRYADSQSWSRRALYEARRPAHVNREIEALANAQLGLLASNIGDYEEARAFLHAAREIVGTFGDDSWLAEIDGNLGTIAVDLNEHEAALRVMRRLAEYYEQHDKPLYRLVARLNMAEIRRREGKLDLALRIMQSVRRDADRLGNPEQLRSVYAELATIHRLRGDDQRALNYQTQQLELARKTGSIDAEVNGLAELAAIRLMRGENKLALEAATTGSEMVSFLFDRLPPDQAASARRRTAGLYAAGLEAALALGDLKRACQFIEAGRAGALLTRLQGRSLIRSAVIDPALLTEEQRTRAAEATAQRVYRQAQEARKLKPVVAARRAYERARWTHKQAIDRILLEASIEADLIHPEPASPDELQAAIRPGEAIVLYERAGTNLVALVLASGEQGRLVSLGEAKIVTEACAAWQFGPERRDAQANPGELRRLLVEPLGLKQSIKRVLVSPVECLSYLSAALLFPTRETAFVPSVTTYARLRAGDRDPAGPVLALGDPVYGAAPAGWSQAMAVRGGSLAPLPGTRAEANAVGDTVLLGAEASETRLRAVLSSQKRWRCIHLACHGLVNEIRPSYSALALTPSDEDDGMLTAFDVSQLDIQADLVVLSACETARGKVAKAEGIVGLMRAFMAAGARRVLVSLWKVDDKASRELMIQFHKLWNAKDPTKRLNAAAALRAAQVHVRDYAKLHGGKHPEWAHPHYWAAWQLWGPAD